MTVATATVLASRYVNLQLIKGDHHCCCGAFISLLFYEKLFYLISDSKYTSNFPITTGEILVLCQTDSCVNGFRRDVKSFFNVNDSVDGLMDGWMVGRSMDDGSSSLPNPVTMLRNQDNWGL